MWERVIPMDKEHQTATKIICFGIVSIHPQSTIVSVCGVHICHFKSASEV